MALELNGTTGVSLVQDGVVTQADLASGVGGKFVSYAVLWDEKTADTPGGTFTQDAYRTRDLNQESDPDGIVTLSSNQFTLGAGTYLIKWSAPAYNVARNGTIIRNITDSTVSGTGTAEYNDTASSVHVRSTGSVRVNIASSKTFEIQHRCQTTHATFGFGVDTGWVPEIYTIVEIYKEA